MIDFVLQLTERFALHRELTEFLYCYTRELSTSSEREIIEADAKRLAFGLGETVPADNLALRAESQRYFDDLERSQVAVDVELRKRLDHPDLQIVRVVLQRPRERGETSEITGSRRRKRLWSLVQDYTTAQFAHLFAVCTLFAQQSPIGLNAARVRLGASGVLDVLAEHKPTLFIAVLEEYLNSGDRLVLQDPPLRQLLAAAGPADALDLLARCAFPRRDEWVLRLLLSLPAPALCETRAGRLVELFRSLPLTALPASSWSVLSSLQDGGTVLTRVAEVIQARRGENQSKDFPIAEQLFRCEGAVRQLLDIEPDVLETLYLCATALQPSIDSSAKVFNTLQDRDPAFIERYLASRPTPYGCGKHLRPYDAVWLREDFMQVFDHVVDWELARTERPGCAHPLALFLNVSTGPSADEVWHRQETFLDNLIKRHSHSQRVMAAVFETIVEWPEDRYRERLRTFVAHNPSFEAFESLALIRTGMSSMGSAVPVRLKRASYLRSLLEFLVGVRFLEHRRHVEQLVSYELAWAEEHKKTDFMRGG